MAVEHIAIIGAGQMGNGIAQVSACAGYKVTMIDIKQEFVDRGMETIKKSLNKLVSKGRMSEKEAEMAISRISTSTENSSASAAASATWSRCCRPRIVGRACGSLSAAHPPPARTGPRRVRRFALRERCMPSGQQRSRVGR